MFRFQRLGPLAVLAVAITTPYLYAQVGSTATITGTITDNAGATVPSATVTVTNTSTGISSKATTNGRGFFTFPQIAIGGPYTIDVDAAGFKKYESTGLMLNLNENRSIDAKLDVGSTSQTVEVVATNGAVDTTDTQLKDTINASRNRTDSALRSGCDRSAEAAGGQRRVL